MDGSEECSGLGDTPKLLLLGGPHPAACKSLARPGSFLPRLGPPIPAISAFPLVSFRASSEVIEDTHPKEGNNRGAESVFDDS